MDLNNARTRNSIRLHIPKSLIVENWIKIDWWISKHNPLINSVTFNQNFIPELFYVLCGKPNMLSKGPHSYSPSNTCCIHSCGNLRALCIERRSLFGEVASAMVATCSLLPFLHLLHNWVLPPQQHLLHLPNSIIPINQKKHAQLVNNWIYASKNKIK